MPYVAVQGSKGKNILVVEPLAAYFTHLVEYLTSYGGQRPIRLKSMRLTTTLQ